MAKKPFPGAAPGGPSAAQSEAVGKFDKFGTFALALPATILAIVALMVADGYTMKHHGWSLIRTPTQPSYDSTMQGTDGIVSATAAQVVGFSQDNYIGRSSEGEVDAAELSVGYDNGVRMGDVFTLKTEPEGVRLEFVVFDVQAATSRAYILLGQNLSGEGAARKYGLKRTQLVDLCGKESGIEVKRVWSDQQVRRHTERRSSQQ
ncbi:MAG: hypothetical protein ACYTDT_05245 [Planctomycetota bacterium]|jgi:hypothetical protein